MKGQMIIFLVLLEYILGYPEYSSYVDSGLPTTGLLYNHASHGFLSTPKNLSFLFPGNSVIVGREKDKKLGISIFQPNSRMNLYNLKVISLDGKNKDTKTVLAVTALGVISKVKYNENNLGQYFRIEPSKRYEGYFQILYKNLCLTPNRDQVIGLSNCFTEESRAFGKQLFKMYHTNNLDDTEKDSRDPITIKRGISPYYFQGCGPCRRYMADPSIGQYILIDKEFCNKNCFRMDSQPVKKEKEMPTARPYRPRTYNYDGDDEGSSENDSDDSGYSSSRANPRQRKPEKTKINQDPVEAVNAAIKIKDTVVPKVPGLKDVMDTIPNVIKNITKK